MFDFVTTDFSRVALHTNLKESEQPLCEHWLVSLERLGEHFYGIGIALLCNLPRCNRPTLSHAILLLDMEEGIWLGNIQIHVIVNNRISVSHPSDPVFVSGVLINRSFRVLKI